MVIERENVGGVVGQREDIYTRSGMGTVSTKDTVNFSYLSD